MFSQGWLRVGSASAGKICLNAKQDDPSLPSILQASPLLRPLTYHPRHGCRISRTWAASQEEVAKLLPAVHQTGDVIPPPRHICNSLVQASKDKQ